MEASENFMADTCCDELGSFGGYECLKGTVVSFFVHLVDTLSLIDPVLVTL